MEYDFDGMDQDYESEAGEIDLEGLVEDYDDMDETGDEMDELVSEEHDIPSEGIDELPTDDEIMEEIMLEEEQAERDRYFDELAQREFADEMEFDKVLEKIITEQGDLARDQGVREEMEYEKDWNIEQGLKAESENPGLTGTKEEEKILEEDIIFDR
jgi:hypothetical protein